jgi:hypothetical protein
MISQIMAKPIRDIPKKRGRGRPKTTGRGEAVLLRLHPPLITALDRWAKRQEGSVSRPEAIRRLIEQGLAGTGLERTTSRGAAQKASDLAAAAIENLTDPSQPSEQKQKAKRRLIQGPEEFRDIRGDQPRRK